MRSVAENDAARQDVHIRLVAETLRNYYIFDADVGLSVAEIIRASVFV